jgi:predicted metalloprotease with PDZ domain
MSDDTRSLAYSLRFTEPQAHLLDVELRIPSPDPEKPLELWLPAWTPGSYLIREYARHIQDLRAADDRGNPVSSRKTAKNIWEIGPVDADRVIVSYRVYGRELSVRTNWIEGDFALLNGAPTFLTVRGREDQPHDIDVEIPRGWAGVWTTMDRRTSGTEADSLPFTARNHDEVVDSPILAGTPDVHEFEVDGIPLCLVNVGEGGLWDGSKATNDVRAIVLAYRSMYGALPFDRYLFMNLIVEARGGLEHRKSCVMMTSRYAFRRRKAYVDWLGLVSHEFFHVWNVKRSRPLALGPFDYENENYTRSLWVAEGITAYYTDLVPCRAGLYTPTEYLETLSQNIQKLQSTPGRLHQSLEESSLDAWIKLYRPDENTANTTISYYLKGAVVAWLLDAAIRTATGDERSLDDMMRILFERYSGSKGFTDMEVQTVAEEVAGTVLATFFDQNIRGTDELIYDDPLRYWGLRFKPADPPPDSQRGWMGIDAAGREGRLVIRSVREGGPARETGLNVGDEILALGGYRVTPQTFADRLHQYAPGDRLEVMVARRDAVQVVPITLAESPRESWRLELDPDAGEQAIAARNLWLGKSPGRD